MHIFTAAFGFLVEKNVFEISWKHPVQNFKRFEDSFTLTTTNFLNTT